MNDTEGHAPIVDGCVQVVTPRGLRVFATIEDARKAGVVPPVAKRVEVQDGKRS